jgi:hypothetical protein
LIKHQSGRLDELGWRRKWLAFTFGTSWAKLSPFTRIRHRITLD